MTVWLIRRVFCVFFRALDVRHLVLADKLETDVAVVVVANRTSLVSRLADEAREKGI